MKRLIGRHFVEKLINEQMNEFAIENRSFRVLRESNIRENILDNVIDMVSDDYMGEDINQNDLFNFANEIYGALLIGINE